MYVTDRRIMMKAKIKQQVIATLLKLRQPALANAVAKILTTAELKEGAKVKVNVPLAKRKLPPQQLKIMAQDLKRGGGFLQIDSISNGMAEVFPWDNPGAKIMGGLTVPVEILVAAAVQVGR